MNIVLLVVDTWRKKDFVKDNSIAPFLSEKSEEGLHLENYYANSPWTVPAHASLFSGKLPSEHGTTTEKTYFSEQNTLTSMLESEGFSTSAFTENHLITEETGFSEGFQQFVQTTEDLGGETWKEIWQKDDEFAGRKEKYGYFFKETLKKRDIDSAKSFFQHITDKFTSREADHNSGKTVRTLEEANKKLKSEKDEFVFANIMPVHSPYTFDEEDKEKYLSDYSEEEILDASQTKVLEDYLPEGFSDTKLDIRQKAYKASIRYADRKITNFYREAPEDTVFIVLGDHGELIGEYEQQGTKLIGHHLGTYKELVEVPCIIFSKGRELDLEIEAKSLYSHTEMRDIIHSLIQDSEVEPQEILNSEYFGRKGFVEQFGRKIPEGCEQIYNRKSFSLINSEIKYDLTTDGEYAWPIKDLTESNPIEIPEELQNKTSVLYEWRF
jgi:arylsulfatase A-like enzyme